ncbi:MAG: LLM class F420-dependent oxidoreductase [Deltaproteobacteria bacterium]|nr:LLM class F420-dependent oxidoreductase [Deltaproteobacteria bacterium]MBW2413524.1 LLM class F420-dependent oxidoreductase [Deltaproteobacteria bacterium]
MQIAIGVGGAASGRERDWESQVEFVVEAEKLGADFVWTAEAWGQDAVTPLAFLAARTSRIRLGTGIMQLSARTPSMTAMTALTMAAISNDRFVLGLGASGPQVVEGLQGQPFARPLQRMRETIDVVRLAFAGEKLQYEGKQIRLPRPGGEGKALRLSQPGNDKIPIYLATLSPKALELTGELADGWLGTSFTPEHAEAFTPHLAAGAEKAGKRVEDLDLQVGGSVEFGDDVERMIAARKPGVAFSLGAMGSGKTNFYNDAYKRGGYADAATEVQRLWLDGKREQAAERVPDDMVLQTNLLGSEDMVRERIRKYRDCGATTLRLAPGGRDSTARLDTLGRAIALVRQLDAEAKG